MKIISQIVSLLVLVFICRSPLAALTLDKDKIREFKECKAYGISADFSNAIVCGLKIGEYKKFYAEKNSVSEQYVDMLFSQFENALLTRPEGVLENKPFFLGNPATFYPLDSSSPRPFNLHIKIISINENASVTALCTLYTDDINDGYSFDIRVGEGRWNDFEVLVKENLAEVNWKAARQLRKMRHKIPKELQKNEVKKQKAPRVKKEKKKKKMDWSNHDYEIDHVYHDDEQLLVD
ncbi:MAG: hypothetical protein NC418_03615 [Muribaculaceae bacterium]|nr:hypothetical protein [Muribaculaceae bacterium]